MNLILLLTADWVLQAHQSTAKSDDALCRNWPPYKNSYFKIFYSPGAERQKRNEMLYELRRFDETGIITARLSVLLNQLPLSSLFSMTPSIAIATRGDLICTACNTVIDVLTEYIETHSPEEILNLLSTVCIQVANYNTEVCHGVISLNLVSDIL
jgi:hypothetical protein